jgi:hypothetical protein
LGPSASTRPTEVGTPSVAVTMVMGVAAGHQNMSKFGNLAAYA